ncbi:MAG: ribonuclease III [Gammaproteobacteria bacterium]|nr:ribonuclease III [Gammaproteobacteria bacterium]
MRDLNRPLSALLRRLAYSFKQPQLLQDALTHRSVGSRNNERLEFLGDGILNFVIAAELFQLKPNCNEGDLSRLRASLVKGETLAVIARELDLGDCLKLGGGELKSGGYRRDSILADAVEAILGAIYQDSGFDSCRTVILHLFKDRLQNLPSSDILKDPKTRLQEYLQSRKLALPAYEVINAMGKAHEQKFTVECRIKELDHLSQATATSRRKAEQAAALLILEQVTLKKTAKQT